MRWGLTPAPADTGSEHLSGRKQTDTEEPPGTQPAPPQHSLTTPAPGHPFAHLAPVYLVHNLLLQQVTAPRCRIWHRAASAPCYTSTTQLWHGAAPARHCYSTRLVQRRVALAPCGSGTELVRHGATPAQHDSGTALL